MATVTVRIRAGPSRLFIASYYCFVVALLLTAAFLWRPVSFLNVYTRVRLSLAGAHDGIAQAGSYRIHYYVAGSGRPIVLLHGLGSDALFWADYIPVLAKQSRVYAIDLLGFGDSERPDVSYRATLQAQVLRDFLVSQNIPQADIVGGSMGAFIALHLARSYPEHVRRLVIADASGIIFDPSRPRRPFPADEQQFRRLMTPKSSSIPSFVARDLLRRMRAQSWVIQRVVRNGNAGTDFLDGKLETLTMPVLLVWGERDILTPLSWGQALHRQIPQSELIVLQGCGHIALFDCRSQVLPEIQRFLSSPEPTAGGVRTIIAK